MMAEESKGKAEKSGIARRLTSGRSNNHGGSNLYGSFFTVLLMLLLCKAITTTAQNATGRIKLDPPPLKISTHDLLLKVGESAQVLITPTSNFLPVFQNATSTPVVLVFHYVPSNLTVIRPLANLTLVENGTGPVVQNHTVNIVALEAGKVTLTSEIIPGISIYSPTDIFLRVSVYKLKTLNILSTVVGWIYFFAWSISFYPQIIQNYVRKSVRGLSLDFVFLNITGFALYGIYNIGLFWFGSVQEQYYKQHPQGVIPVELNDVVFTLHAVFACGVTVIQCLIYDRGSQTVSDTGKMLMCTILVFIFVLFVVAASQAIAWLTFLTWCSYVKLVITMIKYLPQAYLNWYRKSTSGWSIGNILLDFTGGIFSLTQMMFIIYNHNDWSLISGDLTKFGLGLFSILFDIFFIVQHFVLYRHHAEYEPIEGGDSPVEPITQYGSDITTSNHHFTSPDTDKISIDEYKVPNVSYEQREPEDNVSSEEREPEHDSSSESKEPENSVSSEPKAPENNASSEPKAPENNVSSEPKEPEKNVSSEQKEPEYRPLSSASGGEPADVDDEENKVIAKDSANTVDATEVDSKDT